MRTLGVALVVCGLVLSGAALPSHADTLPPGDDPIVAPAADGTDGAYDISPRQPIGQYPSALGGSASPQSTTLCDANTTWYTTSGAVKSGSVTNWGKHVKNDAVSETITFSTSTAVTVSATASVTGSLTGSVAVKKVAEVALGLTGNFGTTGQVATTATYTRAVTFNTPGKWIIWAGVYKGNGSVQMKKCAGNGQSYSTIGTGTAVTFDKGRVTGLTNCANSVSDLVEANAKSRC